MKVSSIKQLSLPDSLQQTKSFFIESYRRQLHSQWSSPSLSWPTWRRGTSWRRSTVTCITGMWCIFFLEPRSFLDGNVKVLNSFPMCLLERNWEEVCQWSKDGDQWRGWDHHEDRGGAHQGSGGREREQRLGVSWQELERWRRDLLQVNRRLESLMRERRLVEHVELDEFLVRTIDLL